MIFSMNTGVLADEADVPEAEKNEANVPETERNEAAEPAGSVSAPEGWSVSGSNWEYDEGSNTLTITGNGVTIENRSRKPDPVYGRRGFGCVICQKQELSVFDR